MKTYYEAKDRKSYYKTIVRALTGEHYPNVSVLDLAAGGHCILEEVVRDQVEYTAVEIRKPNVDTLMKQVGALSPKARVVQGDAVAFTNCIDGDFDVIFIAGLLYHLSMGDHVKILKNAIGCARKGLVLCTVLCHEKMNTANPAYYAYDGYVFETRTFFEHAKADSDNLIESRIRASYQRAGEQYPSCVFTEDSLIRLLRKFGCDMVQRYRTSPMVGDMPVTEVPNAGDHTKPFTALMNNERGTLLVHLGQSFQNAPRPSGVMADPDRDIDLRLTDAELTTFRTRVCDHIKAFKGNPLEAAHQVAHMLPLSLHHNIILGAIDAGMSVKEAVQLRMYLESYLRVCNDPRAPEACRVLKEYLGFVNDHNPDAFASLLQSIRNYLWQHLPSMVRETIEELSRRQGETK